MTRRIRVFPARPSGFTRGAFGLVLALLIPMLAMALPARAAQAMQLSPQQKQDVRLHYERATRAYDLNKYQEAVDEYQKVYEIDGDPVMLYNIGQAYRLNDQPQESIHFYRRYLQRSPEAKNRDDVNRKIVNLEKLIEDRRKAAAAVTPPPPSAKVPLVEQRAPPPPAPVVVPVVVQPPPPPPVPPSTAQRGVGWTMVGLGLIADGVAIAEGIRAKNFGDQLTKASKPSDPPIFNPSIESSGKTANLVAIVCGIAGTAVAITGAIVLITNGSSGASRPETTAAPETVSFRFTPWVGPGLVGGGMGLRF
jgi:Tetratricopeptide repeat